MDRQDAGSKRALEQNLETLCDRGVGLDVLQEFVLKKPEEYVLYPGDLAGVLENVFLDGWEELAHWGSRSFLL